MNGGGEGANIYDRNGRLLYTLSDPATGKHIHVPLSEIPDGLKEAVIATEDPRFYSNPGFDVLSTMRALWDNLRGGAVVAGGSTITQQVIRTVLLPPAQRSERTVNRKLNEWVLAYKLTRQYSKDQILELYLNEIDFGNTASGVEAAAQIYFGKHVRELDLAESAMLAGLPQNPAQLDPLTNPEAAKARQRIVLSLMVKHGYLSQASADLTANERLAFAPQRFPIEAPHFVMYVREMLEERYGREALLNDGLRVYTTLDLPLQQLAERTVQRNVALLKKKDVSNGALVALDPATAQILAMVGSADYFNPQIDGAVNVALAPRQPGSSIKPFTYAAAFEAHVATPATVVYDIPTSFPAPDGTSYAPENYDRQWHGPVSLRTALACSYNLPAVEVLAMAGVEPMLALAQRSGITTLDGKADSHNLSLTLGSGEVRLLEETEAYGVFATGGIHHPSVAILRVEDKNGKVLEAWQPAAGERVLSPQAAYLITDILADPLARSPEFGENSALYLPGRPAAVKTGTTTDWRDNWTVGYTPELVTGVWVGNAGNEAMQNVSGISGAAPIWHDFMLEALRTRPAIPFQQPDGLVRVRVSALSGKLAQPWTPDARDELFIRGTEPHEPDDIYRQVNVDKRNGLLATTTTPAQDVVQRIYAYLPPQLEEWAAAQGYDQPPQAYSRLDQAGSEQQPVQSAATTANGAAVRLVSPEPNAIYVISRMIPRATQQVEISARLGTTAVTRIELRVDGTIIATPHGEPYHAWWTLVPGEHVISVLAYDATGAVIGQDSVQIQVRAPGE